MPYDIHEVINYSGDDKREAIWIHKVDHEKALADARSEDWERITELETELQSIRPESSQEIDDENNNVNRIDLPSALLPITELEAALHDMAESSKEYGRKTHYEGADNGTCLKLINPDSRCDCGTDEFISKINALVAKVLEK